MPSRIIQQHRYRIWLIVALIGLCFVAAGVLWTWDTPPDASQSPINPPLAGASPLETPRATPTPIPSSWTGAGAALLWIMLGILLALGIISAIYIWDRRSA
jgi:hypothetical protein